MSLNFWPDQIRVAYIHTFGWDEKGTYKTFLTTKLRSLKTSEQINSLGQLQIIQTGF